MRFIPKKIGKVSGKYKYVYPVTYNNSPGVYHFRAYISHLKLCETFDTEREAALCVDKILIMNGKKPVNILIPKIDAK